MPSDPGDTPVGLAGVNTGLTGTAGSEQRTRACVQATGPGPALVSCLLTYVRVFLKTTVKGTRKFCIDLVWENILK